MTVTERTANDLSTNMKHRTTHTLALVLLLFAGIYGLFQARAYLQGPIVELRLPIAGTTLTESTFVVHGYADHISHLLLNGRQIFVNEHGEFEETLPVPLGYFTITVEAEDRFGRTLTRSASMLGKPPTLAQSHARSVQLVSLEE